MTLVQQQPSSVASLIVGYNVPCPTSCEITELSTVPPSATQES